MSEALEQVALGLGVPIRARLDWGAGLMSPNQSTDRGFGADPFDVNNLALNGDAKMGRTPGQCPVTGILACMKAKVDAEGRLVILKPLRDRLGLLPGAVEVVVDGTGIHIEPIATDELGEEAGGRLVIGASGLPVDDEMVRGLRLADQT